MLRNMIILSIESVMTVDSPKGRRASMVNRPSYGITFSYEGQITYYHRDKQTISDPKHMVLLPKGENYELYGNTSGRFPVINIQCSSSFQLHNILSFPIKNPEQYYCDFERLKELYLLGTDQPQCLSILYRMISRILSDGLNCNRIITSATQYIAQNYQDASLSNAIIASNLSISEVYLNKLFREVLHTSPKQYIIDLRMKKAQQLLSESNCSVHEIAEQCGYASMYHFSRAFRHAIGVSPSDFRRSSSFGVI